MARPPAKHPTEGELEILRVLWANGKSPLGAICEALRQQRPVATTTVATMLGVMLDKGIVKRTKTPRGYLWSAGVSRERTANTLVDKLVEGVFEGSTQRLIAHLVENTPLGEKELAEITAMIHSKPKPPKPTGGGK